VKWSWSAPENLSPGCLRSDNDAAAAAAADDDDVNWRREMARQRRQSGRRADWLTDTPWQWLEARSVKGKTID